MRSLPSIIKASQYGVVSGRSVNPAELPHARSASAAASAASSADAKNRHEAIVNEAFRKAKDIVEATQNYSLNQLKESAMRMNEECAEMKIRSYEDGYARGLAEGKQEGEQLGYDDGYRQGLKKAHEEVEAENREQSESAKQEIGRMLESIENGKSEILTKFKEDLEGLSVEIARKVVRMELRTDEKALQSIIESVLESYRNQAWVKINVSPSNAELLMKADQGMIRDLQKVSGNVKIVSSPEMDDGGCVIDLPDRLIDAGVDTQFDQIQTALGL
jgi:Flagellar biosynthesis/type III secretory pathway protein